MPRCQVGLVQALWRYPVKSLRGESLDATLVTENGVAGDRVWALRELDRGGIMSARTWAAMLDLNATWQGDPTSDAAARVYIELPGGNTICADDPDASRVLSDLFRRKVRLERIRTERITPEELEAVLRGEAFPPRRDFFDEDAMHLIASGTLDHLRSLRPGSDFDPRRFRANVYIDTGSGGFIEDQWLDGVLEIGESVRIAGMRPSIRCAITTHAQSDLPRDVAILRTAWQHHQAYVGVFASVAAPGKIRVGDPVVLAT
ncbi:MAG TPA: MOSC N-terminal beta barrel domain-containing protein [Candidatus Binataceae bacterium]|nr:MOSC N-terminal beta barrel domain-containing protein [Candidatus Binataceae bacterium]